jgi:tetratricopeptide (TPR) repeat protein
MRISVPRGARRSFWWGGPPGLQPAPRPAFWDFLCGLVIQCAKADEGVGRGPGGPPHQKRVASAIRAVFCVVLPALMWAAQSDLEMARDRQDRIALEKIAEQAGAAAQQADNDPIAQYRAAVAYSDLAEVAQEQRDKAVVKRAAEAGIRSAERAVALKPDVAEYRRILGTLYGQIVPVNILLGLSYGKKSQDSIAKALELDPKLSAAYISRGVGNYYVPSGFGGGLDLAIRDFQKAIELNPKSDEAYLWLGLAMRKSNRNAEARKAFSKSLELNPNRVWTKQQLEKTPAN